MNTLSETVKFLTFNLDAHASNLDTTQKSSQFYIYIYIYIMTAYYLSKRRSYSPTDTESHPERFVFSVFGVSSP